MLVKSETGGSGGLVRVRADSCAQLARRRGRGTRHWATVWAGQTAVEGGWGVGQRRGGFSLSGIHTLSLFPSAIPSQVLIAFCVSVWLKLWGTEGKN